MYDLPMMIVIVFFKSDFFFSLSCVRCTSCWAWPWSRCASAWCRRRWCKGFDHSEEKSESWKTINYFLFTFFYFANPAQILQEKNLKVIVSSDHTSQWISEFSNKFKYFLSTLRRTVKNVKNLLHNDTLIDWTSQKTN